MVTSGIFGKSHLDDLKVALDVYARRHEVTAENIANVQTDGYRSRAVRFEEELDGASRRLQGVRTNAHHLPVGRRGLADAVGEVQETGVDYDNGVNDVDVDAEMAALATNDLSYRLATRLLSMKYGLLRGAVRGQMR
ncbi:MAG: flagellar basal body rod protein FlgB [Candidatus Krumholzibacteriia bacterium]